MEIPDGTYPFFVYGTLRPGNALWPWLRGSVHDEKAFQAWVKGYRLTNSAAGEYPVMLHQAYRPETKIVRGTLVYVRNTKQFRDIWSMEVNAGYEVETVEVFTGAGVDNLRKCVDAMAFVWPDKEYNRGAVGEYMSPKMEGQVSVWDWNLRPVLHLPGIEEVQSIPSQRR